MPPPLIQLKDIALTFGGTPLLSGVELSVSTGERVCLIGRNGSGKSTLLKIAAGTVEADSGSRFVQPGATIRYLPQEPDFTGFPTTLAYVEAGLGPGDDHYQARFLLEQLGLHWRRGPRASVGRRRRGAPRLPASWRPRPISCCWTSPPTISISPPSNGWNANWTAGAARLSSSAMTAASSPICRAPPRGSTAARSGRSTAASAISRPGATRCWRRKNATSTSSTARSSTRSTGCATAFPAAASATSSGSAIFTRCASSGAIIGALPATPTSPPPRPTNPASSSSKPRAFRASYGERKIVDDFSIRVQRGDRIGIVGPNGAGKTTLIEMLTGGKPPDAGSIRFGANHRNGDTGPASRKPRSEIDAGRRADRRRQRSRHGRRQAEARRQLHEGLPVRPGADAHAARGALRRRARPADAGPRAGEAVQPPGAGRAHQRPRSRDPRRAGRNARRLRGHGHPDQP